uniref:Uncharacterized protein n=1 Tax=Opuntia streptacantha TaxID=393608 RepID=A0A7C9A8T7_OPUST
MKYASQCEGWYIEIHNFVHFKIWSMICLLQYCIILICICLVVFDACAMSADDGHAQRRLMLIHRKRLRILNLEKLFVARRFTLNECSPMSNVQRVHSAWVVELLAHIAQYYMPRPWKH